MTKIRTAEDSLKAYLKMSWDHEYAENGIISKSDAIEFAKEYAKQFIDLAADEVNLKTLHEPGNDTFRHGISITVDKESILKIKDLIK